jgi:hypothetical protein
VRISLRRDATPSIGPANCGAFARVQEISLFDRVRGGPGRTRTSNQAVMSAPCYLEKPMITGISRPFDIGYWQLVRACCWLPIGRPRPSKKIVRGSNQTRCLTTQSGAITAPKVSRNVYAGEFASAAIAASLFAGRDFGTISKGKPGPPQGDRQLIRSAPLVVPPAAALGLFSRRRRFFQSVVVAEREHDHHGADCERCNQ